MGDWTTINVWCDLGIKQFAQDKNLLGLPDATTASDIRLQNGNTGFQTFVKLLFSCQALAGGDRDGGGTCYFADGLDLVRRARLFKP